MSAKCSADSRLGSIIKNLTIMEIKKNPKVDVNNKRTVLLEIGLCLALLAVIGAFLYAPKDVVVEEIDMNYGPVE